LFQHLGRWVYRNRRLLFLVWSMLLAAGITLAARLPAVFKEDVTGASGREAALGERIMKAQFPGQLPRPLLLVLYSPKRTVADADYERTITRLTLSLLREPYVRRVFNVGNSGEAAMVSRDQHSTYLLIDLGGTPAAEVLSTVVPALRATVAAVSRPPDLQANLTGTEAVLADFTAAAVADQRRIEAVVRPLAGVMAILVFGGIVGALMTLAMGMVSVVLASAGLYLLGTFATDGVPALAGALVVLLGLSTGIDYSLIMLTRFREELDRGLPLPLAVEQTIATAGRTVAYAGALVMTGVAFLFIPQLHLLRMTALGGLMVVGCAILAALTFLPVIMAGLAPLLDWPRPLAAWLRRWPVEQFWLRWHRWITARPYLSLLIGVPLFAVLIAPAAGMRLWEVGVTAAPAYLESSRGYAELQRIMKPGEMDPIYVIIRVVDEQPIWTEQTLSGLYRLSRELHQQSQVAAVESIVDLDPRFTLDDYRLIYLNQGVDPLQTIWGQLVTTMVNGHNGANATLLKIVPREASSPALRRFINKLRDKILPGIPELHESQKLVTGTSARYIDLDRELYDPVLWMLPTYLILIYALLFLLFRSFVLPLKALLVNALPVAASLGILTSVMQQGWGAHWLGITPAGAVMAQSPLVLFAILFGLSMDYEVLMLMRVQEEYRRCGDNKEAVIQGLSRSAKIITGGAAIMLSVYIPFLFSDLVPNQELGLGLSAGVLLDATLVRLFLVPGAMVLLGKWNWYPGVKRDE